LKVENLKVGMIVRPIINKWTDRRMTLKVKSVSTYNSQDDENPVSDGLMCDISCDIHSNHPGVGIYMGFENSNYWMSGVKKHHQILIGNILANLSGYDVKYLEPVEENESKK